MELKFLGIGAAYYPSLGSTSAYFTVQDHFYLIDCGETIFASVWNNRDLQKCTDIHVLITHLHSDHIGSLGTFVSYCKKILNKDVTVLSPDKTIKNILSLTGVSADSYNYCCDFYDIFPGNLTIVPNSTSHVSNMPCYGYMISVGEERVYYGGDSDSIPSEVLLGLKDGSIDLAFQEVTYQTGCHSGHISLEQLCQIVPADIRHKVICMHFGGDFMDAVIKAGFRVAERVL
ncbi:MAG: MBL fold metallo-hydrolase [Christensenellaceae bacterium]|nr:MBL fold metallo-hydrolase [Christensenellaceae bacterium]